MKNGKKNTTKMAVMKFFSYLNNFASCKTQLLNGPLRFRIWYITYFSPVRGTEKKIGTFACTTLQHQNPVHEEKMNTKYSIIDLTKNITLLLSHSLVFL